MIRRLDDPVPPVGGYTLHLYCRNENPDHPFNQAGEFGGSTEADANRGAKARGWVFHRDNTVTCPVCARSLGLR